MTATSVNDDELHGVHGVHGVHEAYSFACMRCGHGWEQSYEIVHHEAADGQLFVTYHDSAAGGARVPSPLSKPTCPNCDGHLVRIMRSGRVATAARAISGAARPRAARVRVRRR